MPSIAVVAAGAMGGAVGRRLHKSGARVLTSLQGRETVTADRARAAGMIAASDEAIAAADIILSIVPPAEAVALVERLAPPIAAAARKPTLTVIASEARQSKPWSSARIAAALRASQ